MPRFARGGKVEGPRDEALMARVAAEVACSYTLPVDATRAYGARILEQINQAREARLTHEDPG